MEVDEASDKTLVASSEVGSENGGGFEGGVGVKSDIGDGAKRGFDVTASGEVESGDAVILEGGVGVKDGIGNGVERGFDVVAFGEVGSGNGVILEDGKDDNGDEVKRGSDIVTSGEMGSGNGVILEGGNDDNGDEVKRGSDIVTSGEVGSGNGVILEGGVVLEGGVGAKDDNGDEVKRGSDIVAYDEVGSGNGVILESVLGVKDDGVGRGSDLGGDDKEMKSGVENDNGPLILKDGVAEQKGERNSVENDESDYDDYDDYDYDGDNIGDQSCEYQVGDFVWGKIKSYPWWPGQIYGESDASEFALKLKQKDRFLVAYFGDGSFSWCGPSQLKPFVKNFKAMSEQSNSKNFTYAVEAALDEVSRGVEREMACSCLAEKNGKLEASMVSNSGLKVGVLVPVGIGKSFIAQCEPEKLMDSLRNYAETLSMKNLFELTVIKSWLTVYCRTKGGYPLPLYHYPRGIEGLEDKSGNPVKFSVQGPNGEDWSSVPVEALGSGLNLPNQSLLSKCQETSSDIMYQRRKQKSVAELIDDEMRKEEGFVKESVSNVVSTGKRGRRSKAVASQTVRDKIATCESNDFGEKEVEESHRSGALQNKILSGGESEGEVETAKSNRLRERKRSKYLSPPFTNPSQIMKISSFKRESQTESVKNSRVGERMARVAGQLIGLQSPINETSQTEFPTVSSNNAAKSGSLSPEMQFTANPAQLLSQLQSAAADPSCLKEKIEVEFITENITSFRNKVQQNGEPGSMKRKPECMFQPIENGSNDQDFEMPPAKKAASGCVTMTNNEDAREHKTPVTLILTFPPAYPLPSRTELMKIYAKFGPMIDNETGVWHNSFSAWISYLRGSDAEEAYKASLEKNPFGAANVHYRLRYLPLTLKASKKNQESSLDNGKATQSCDDEATQLGLIREKLNTMTSIVESCDGKISVEVKSNLESEVKILLERVRSMPVTLS